MNVIIQNPNLLKELNNKYKTNTIFLLMNFILENLIQVRKNIFKNRQLSTITQFQSKWKRS